MTLRARFAVAGVIVAVLLVALGLIVPHVVTTSQIAQVDQQLADALPRALIVAKGQQNPNHPSIPKDGPFRADSSERFSNIYIAVVSSKGRHVLVTLGLGNASPTLPSVVSTVTKTQLKIETVSSLHSSSQWRAVLVRYPTGQEVLVAASLASVDATDAQLRLALYVAGGSLVLIMAALWWWLVRLGLRPIAEVTAVADAITAGNRERRVREPHPGSEAAHLARAFNVMLDEEQAAEERLRRFVADASHELRTPITVIQGVADLWREGVLDDKETLDDALRRVGQESARIAALVEDLLLLARLDEGHSVRYGQVDLSQLASNVVRDLSVMYPSHDVSEKIDEEVLTTGDDSQLRQVLANLLTNAFIHTPSGTRVRILVRRDDNQSVVEVSDNGPGMDSADLPRAFERFWRSSSARGGRGSGLGLSIVAAIVDSHQGTVDISAASGKGLKVRVSFPSTSVQSRSEERG